MYSINEYKKLASKYGPYASWAIWDYKDQADSSVISKNFDQLHSKFVLLGLNISRPLANKPWSNFHAGPHNVRKLKYACNDNKLGGSYITDIFKGIVESQSTKFKNGLTDKIISGNVNLFNQEMGDIKINEDTKFIILGTPNSLLAQCFNHYFKQEYKNHVIYHYHYSYYGLTDRAWVGGLWDKLNINQNFDLTIEKYNRGGQNQ